MKILGQSALNPEILGYRISHRVRTRVPGSLPTETTFGYQRISETSSGLAPRRWRTLRASAISLLTHPHIAGPASYNIDSARNLQRDDGGANGDRCSNKAAAIADQPVGRLSDVARRRRAHAVWKRVACNGFWGHRNDGNRATLGGDVSGLARSWRRLFLPTARDSSRSWFHHVNNIGAFALHLGADSVGRRVHSLPWSALPTTFQTVDNPVRSVSRRRHNRHSRHPGNPMKRGTKYGYSLRGLKAGDGNAWSWLVAEFSGKLVGYATRMGARDPEEVMSATLETIARRIADFEGNESQMRSFIFSIAHARIVDDLRRATRRSEVSIENTLTLLAADEPNEDTFTDPDLLNALGRLPEDQRQMLELRYVMGLSTKETADAIGKSEVATRVGLSRAFTRLKDLLVDDLRVSAEEEVTS